MSNLLLCIDASTKKTGYAIIDKHTYKIIQHGVFEQVDKDIQGREHRKDRIIYMTNGIRSIIESYNIDEIVQEDVPPAINNSDTVLGLGILQGCMLYLSALYDIPITHISVSTWHSALGIKKSKGNLKEQSVNWVNKKYNTNFIYKTPSSKYNEDDQTDAICIGCYYLDNYEKDDDVYFGKHSVRKE